MKPSIAALVLGGALMSATFPGAAEEQGSPAQDREAIRKQISELKWIRGPQEVQLFG